MNRTHDLRKVMPSIIAAANASLPVEIVVLDYNSQDDLGTYIETVDTGKADLTYSKYIGHDYYHMAHARNLSVLASSGDYVLISSADIGMHPECIAGIRAKLDEGYTWLHHSDRYVGVLCVARQEFIDAGGFDERFEFYGKEDKDLLARLVRRGAPRAQVPDQLWLIPTPWPEKLKNYRLPLSRGEMSKRAKAVYHENIDNAILVANEGQEWGQWA